MRRLACGLLVIGLAAGSPRGAKAQPSPSENADAWRVHAGGHLTVDGGLVLGLPVALGTGLSTGVGVGAMTMLSPVFSWGVRASWATATESSMVWSVTHADLRLRAAAAVQHSAGRGRFGLRLGAGPSVIHESRVRNQGMLAGLTGTALETSAFTTVPAVDLEAVIAVHILGPWLLAMSGGPSLARLDGGAHWGFTGQLGVGWQP